MQAPGATPPPAPTVNPPVEKLTGGGAQPQTSFSLTLCCCHPIYLSAKTQNPRLKMPFLANLLSGAGSSTTTVPVQPPAAPAAAKPKNDPKSSWTPEELANFKAARKESMQDGKEEMKKACEGTNKATKNHARESSYHLASAVAQLNNDKKLSDLSRAMAAAKIGKALDSQAQAAGAKFAARHK